MHTVLNSSEIWSIARAFGSAIFFWNNKSQYKKTKTVEIYGIEIIKVSAKLTKN